MCFAFEVFCVNSEETVVTACPTENKQTKKSKQNGSLGVKVAEIHFSLAKSLRREEINNFKYSVSQSSG